jgi:hypothetical protein
MKTLSAILGVAFAFITVAEATVRETAEKAFTKNTASTVAFAIKAYGTEYGELPPREPKVLLRVLQGEDIDDANPRKIVFWEAQLESRRFWWRERWGNVNDVGQLIDAWGTPFRWIIDGDSWSLHSAGENRKFEDGKGDDIEFPIPTVRPNQAVDSTTTRRHAPCLVATLPARVAPSGSRESL